MLDRGADVLDIDAQSGEVSRQSRLREYEQGFDTFDLRHRDRAEIKPYWYIGKSGVRDGPEVFLLQRHRRGCIAPTAAIDRTNRETGNFADTGSWQA